MSQLAADLAVAMAFACALAAAYLIEALVHLLAPCAGCRTCRDATEREQP